MPEAISRLDLAPTSEAKRWRTRVQYAGYALGAVLLAGGAWASSLYKQTGVEDYLNHSTDPGECLNDTAYDIDKGATISTLEKPENTVLTVRPDPSTGERTLHFTVHPDILGIHETVAPADPYTRQIYGPCEQ